MKMIHPVLYFLETFLKQPKTLLEKEIRPLKHMAESIVAKSKDDEFNYKMKELLDNLSKLECVLEHIIDIETEVECTNR